MEAWMAKFNEFRALWEEDAKEDELMLDAAFNNLQEALGDETTKVTLRGSQPGQAQNVDRERRQGHNRIYGDYFSDNLIYGPTLFRRRFRMRRSLFLHIMERVCAQDSYFIQKPDALGVMGLSSIQKCTAALRMLTYGVCADATDEYCRLGESTTMEAMKRFCVAIRKEFEAHYLRQPTSADFEKQLTINKARGFPGMFASIDCMHYVWKNCPVAWQGDFGDKDGNRSIILEAVADKSLRIWHVFFGMPGANNDINVLDRSPLVKNMLAGAASDRYFIVNGVQYNRYYLLADSIYLQWTCFVQTIHEAVDEKWKHYAKVQEGARKDVERCFGVLQSRFAIIQNPCRQWSLECIHDVMHACCILHNMIIDDESNEGLEQPFEIHSDLPIRRGLTFEDLVSVTVQLENQDVHYSLRGDLIEHLWALKGNSSH